MFRKSASAVVVVVVLAVSLPAFAREDAREGSEPRIVKIIKKGVKALSDVLTVPTPTTKP